MQVQLTAVLDQPVALESVDVNPRDRHFRPGRRHAVELACVSAGESASRYAVGTIDEYFLDDVVAIGKATSELLEIRPPCVPTERSRAADLDDDPRRDQRFECRPVPPVYRRVEALHECADRIIGPISHEANDIYRRTLAMIVSANRSMGSR